MEHVSEGAAVERREGAAGGDRWSYGRIAATFTLLLALVGAALLLLELTRLFLLVFAAVVFAVVFDAIAGGLRRYLPIGRGLSLTLAVLLLLGGFAAGFALFGAQLAGQFDTIAESLPGAVNSVQSQLESWGLGDRVRDAIQQGTSNVSTLVSRVGNYAMVATSGLADFVVVLVGAIFLANNPGVYRRGLLLMLPKPAEKTADLALDDANRGLRGWMLGQLFSSVFVALVTGFGLELLGVPASGGLGLLAGLLDVIPMIGPVIAGIPAVLLAFTASPATALWTVVLFLIIQQIQGNFLQPMIQKQAVDVPPAVLLFAVVGAGTVFGLLGVLLAAPITVVIYVLIQRVYVRTLLGRDVNVAGRAD